MRPAWHVIGPQRVLVSLRVPGGPLRAGRRGGFTMGGLRGLVLIVCTGAAASGPGTRDSSAQTVTRATVAPVGFELVLQGGGAGSWDAGGVFAPRVWRAGGVGRMIYVGKRKPETFGDSMALGYAELRDSGWQRRERPLFSPGALHPDAWGIEAPVLLRAGEDDVGLIVTAVDSARSNVGFFEVVVSLRGGLRSVRQLGSASVPPGDWNERFYIPEAWDSTSNTVFGSGVGGSGWKLGAQILRGDHLAWIDDEETGSPFTISDPVLTSGEGWARHGIFNPSFARIGETPVLLYAGAPGSVESDTPMNAIGWACRGGDGRWRHGSSVLVGPRPGMLLEYPYLDSGTLYLAAVPWPEGRYAIYRLRTDVSDRLACG